MVNKAQTNKNPDFVMKMAFVCIGILVILAMIFGSWVWNLMFSPENFDLNKWANRAVFNGSISLGMMVLGFIAIDETLKANEEGKYQTLIDAFNDLVEDLFTSSRIVYFDLFVPWLADRQLREKKIRYLTMHGMGRLEAEAIVDYAKIEDIEIITGLKPKEKMTFKTFALSLTRKGKEEEEKKEAAEGHDIVRKTRDGKDVLIPAIKGCWAGYVEDVLTGKISITVEDASYYLTASRDRKSNQTSLERSIATDKERVRSLKVAFASKVFAGLVYTALFSLLIVDLNQGATTAEALWNLILRLGSATLGFIAGGFSGSTNVRFLNKWIKEKMMVVREYNKYVDGGEFKLQSFNDTKDSRIKAVIDKEKTIEKTKPQEPITEPNGGI